MDEETFALRKADLHGQTALIDVVFTTLDERALDLSAADEMQLESVAYQIHNLYNAVEDLLKIVVGHFKNQITGTARWYIQRLRRMIQDIVGVRPALLSQEAFRLLNGLHSFRSFFRHAYATPLAYHRLVLNIERARRLRPHLEHDVAHFLERLEPDQ